MYLLTRDEVSDGKLEREIDERIVALTGLKVPLPNQEIVFTHEDYLVASSILMFEACQGDMFICDCCYAQSGGR